MTDKKLFDEVSHEISARVTEKYSTSFSMGITLLDSKLQGAVHAVYGFVRLADEIVDSFALYDQPFLLHKFRLDTQEALEMKISINPILNSFQHVVHAYGIGQNLIDAFLDSMEMDLEQKKYNRIDYDRYINGSAEAVGLMCLKIFTIGNELLYSELAPYARSLGSAFQKVNFLRDAQDDFIQLGRVYFPNVNMENFTMQDKIAIEAEIEAEFNHALIGIRKLPLSSRKGVYLAYVYYRQLFRKIRATPANEVLKKRIRIKNHRKVGLMVGSLLRHELNYL